MIKMCLFVHLSAFTRAKCGAKLDKIFHTDKYFSYFRTVNSTLRYEKMVLPASMADCYCRLSDTGTHSRVAPTPPQLGVAVGMATCVAGGDCLCLQSETA